MVESYATALRGNVDLLWTQGPGHAIELARSATATQDVICVVGGDGTVSEVVNGLMPRPIPIVVIPTGSGNDFASLVDCPRSAEELVSVLDAGVGLRLDVIDCGGRYCANSIGIGFEAMVTYHSLGIKRLRGLPLYLTAVVRALAAYESYPFTLRVDDATVEGDFLLVSAGNGVRSGGGFYLNPGAYPDDGLIDVCVARRMSRARMLSILPSAIRGAHVGKPGIETYRGTTVSVQSTRPFPLHIDGEYLGRRETPLSLRVVSKCLPVLTRPGGRARHTGTLERIVGTATA